MILFNASDFKNFAITKIALQSSAEETNKKYKEALNKAEGKKAPFYIAMDAEPEENNWASVKYEEVFDNRPNLWYYGDGNWFELKAKQSENSQYYIYKTGKIKLVKGVNSKNDYYVESETDKFELLYTLEKNTYGMVKIPDSGDGFGRYGTNDAGGNSGTEVVGSGDRYVLPKTAAALFGIINEVDDKGWEIHLGDMSSDNGSDPWQSGFSHHAGHGHNGTRKGLDVDFRYLNSLGKSFQGNNDSSIFDSDKNKTIFELAHKYGFKKNYCTNVATVFGESISGVSNVSEHKDHGHIGLSDIDLEEVESVNVTII